MNTLILLFAVSQLPPPPKPVIQIKLVAPSLPVGYDKWGLRDNRGVEHTDTDYFKLIETVKKINSTPYPIKQPTIQPAQPTIQPTIQPNHFGLHYHQDGLYQQNYQPAIQQLHYHQQPQYNQIPQYNNIFQSQPNSQMTCGPTG